MGDSLDGSATAQDAPDPSDSSGQRGFFGRIIDALSPSDPDDDTEAGDSNPKNSAPGPLPGIGNLR